MGTYNLYPRMKTSCSSVLSSVLTGVLKSCDFCVSTRCLIFTDVSSVFFVHLKRERRTSLIDFFVFYGCQSNKKVRTMALSHQFFGVSGNITGKEFILLTFIKQLFL